MKIGVLLIPLLAAVTLLCGCQSYQYRVVQPPGVPQPILDQPVSLNYDPLEYRFVRRHDRLAMRIFNPTDDAISLQGARSFVIDPEGETHPMHGRIIGPHSYTRMVLPPIPMQITSYSYWGPGVGWGGWGPGWGPGWGWGWGWGADWYPPEAWTTEIRTQYDWNWHLGPARLQLTYEQAGKTFQQRLEIVREKQP